MFQSVIRSVRPLPNLLAGVVGDCGDLAVGTRFRHSLTPIGSVGAPLSRLRIAQNIPSSVFWLSDFDAGNLDEPDADPSQGSLLLFLATLGRLAILVPDLAVIRIFTNRIITH